MANTRSLTDMLSSRRMLTPERVAFRKQVILERKATQLVILSSVFESFTDPARLEDGFPRFIRPIKRAGGRHVAMWNWTPKDEKKPSGSSHPETTRIGKSIVIKGEVSGSGNVYVAGVVEGNVELHEGNLTVGPEGRIRANVQAHSIVVQGRVDGTCAALSTSS